MQRMFGTVRDGAGNALSSVTVQVNLAGTSTPATIYSDNIFTVLANPFTNNSDGSYQFYAANGRYTVVLTKTNYGFLATATADILLHDDHSFLTPTALSAGANDYNPTNGLGTSLWRLSATVPVSITGVQAPLSNQEAAHVHIVNVGAQNISFTNEDVLSLAANRIITASGATETIAANQSIELFYDQVATRWRTA